MIDYLYIPRKIIFSAEGSISHFPKTIGVSGVYDSVKMRLIYFMYSEIMTDYMTLHSDLS